MRFFPIIRPLKNKEEISILMEKIGVNEGGIDRMSIKSQIFPVHLKYIDYRAANILKQEMLSLGGDAAIHQGVISGAVKKSDVLLLGTEKHFLYLKEKLQNQPFNLKEIGSSIYTSFKNFISSPSSIVISNRKFDFGKRTYLMGILNITPDSFSDGGKFFRFEDAINRAMELIDDGADIIDIGGESTRPGAVPVDAEDEKKRVLPVIEAIMKKNPFPISIDTRKASVAKSAIEAGAGMVNDISGLKGDPEMAQVVAEANVPLVIMHMKGTPQTMQINPEYEDVIMEIAEFFANSIHLALAAGIPREKIILDPGIGFGKTVDHNLQILRELRTFKSFGLPILVGTSRKSFIGKILNAEVQDRLYGTIASCIIAIANGANILRVHDVKELKEAAKVADAILGKNVIA